MPELPEIAAHAERLTRRYAGAVLERVEPIAFTALKTVDPPPEAAVDHPLGRVDRRGKHLLLRFGEVVHVVHLMQGGRLTSDERGARRPANGLVRWHFTSQPPLMLTEGGKERRAGVWVVGGDPEGQPPLDGLGPDADAVTPEALAERLGAASMRVHGFLRDQRMIAGIGRRLANEVCHRARCSPFAPTANLVGEAARLGEAIRACIDAELETERTREEMSRARDRETRVHGRVGEPCPICGDTVRGIEYRDYTVCYCPTCQTDGKVLSDQALSRLGVPREEQGTRRRARKARG